MYSLISYPFYFKFLFAPIIDLYQFQFLGKRKSYILPINLVLSVILLYLSRIDILTNYHILWILGFILCLFLGIQDIAIDGLATDLCKQEGESAALLQNIGFTIGNSFLGNFLFIALYSNQVCSLETFFMLLSIVGLILTIFLYINLYEKEEQEKRATTFQDLLRVFKSFFKNENMITYSLLIFFERTALSSLDATFRLKLVQFNINKTYISFIDTIILPLKIATGLIYHQYFYKYDFKYYGNIQYLRLISTFFAIVTLLLIDKFELEGPFSYIAIFFSNMCWWVLFNITYIVRGNFQMKITTPGVEATTLTILNSISQLGVKLAFSVNLIMANYVNYYWLLCAGWIIHLLYCFRYSETYRNLYMQPIQKCSMLSIFTQIMPILLAEHGFNYEQQGLFSLVAYPFFFKIIFAPIIDLFHFKSLGRRRSYILPCTILMSFNLFWQSSLDIQQNYVLFCLIGLFNATFLGMQDIAIDGFAADLCKKTNESSAHILNVGYTIGSSFLANFLFHSLNKYQLCSLSTYLKMISVFGLSMAAYLLFHVKEEPNSEQIKKLTGFKQVIRGIFGNENLITLSLLLFFDRYGVAPIESTFRIKLTELKFNKAYVSFMDTAILPLKIAVGFVYHKYFSKYNFEYYGYVQGFRLISCIFATLTIFLVDVVKVNDTISYIALFIASTTWWIVFNLTFIVRGNFQMRITTQGYEATTLALMNSLGSLGGKTGFSLCMFLTEYVNYYCFACFALVAQLLFTLKSIKWYKRLYGYLNVDQKVNENRVYNVPKEKYSIIKQNLKSE